MKKTIMILAIILIFVAGCNTDNPSNTNLTDETVSFTDESINLQDNQLTHEELYAYPEWVNGCDRFRPIFKENLEKYSLVNKYFDIEDIYAMTYHESLCQTRGEMREYLKENNNPSETWKGGLMQVDGCWRWDTGYDCALVQDQINLGFLELERGIKKIENAAQKNNVSLNNEEMLKSILMAYNRGYYVIEDAFEIYNEPEKYAAGNLIVNCTEKDVCMSDGEQIDISDEYAALTEPYDKALFVACKKNYGTMHDAQGDYCTGPGYGLNYPKEIFKIIQEIEEYDYTKNPATQKEFYGKQIEFSDHKWLVKTSIENKTGPGPNYFNHEEDSVFIDSEGNLHMKIIKKDGKWYSSELVLEPLGYGVYRFEIGSDISNLDPNAVLGLFTYDLSFESQDDYYHREIDFEAAKWGQQNIENAQFALQGPRPLKAIERFYINTSDNLIAEFNWSEKNVTFSMETTNNTLLNSWHYDGYLVPDEGTENTRLNFWIYDGEPKYAAESEIIIKRFEFVENK